jgi:hypothetical protein
VAAPRGYLIITDPDAPTKEWDTFTCCHCQRIVPIRPRAPASECGGFCRLCFKEICGTCADKGSCDPFEKQLERIEARGRMLQSIFG